MHPGAPWRPCRIDIQKYQNQPPILGDSMCGNSLLTCKGSGRALSAYNAAPRACAPGLDERAEGVW